MPRSRLLAGALALVALTFGLAACSGAATSGKPVVVVTHSVLGDAVRHAVGDQVGVEVLMPAGADPHEFEPSAAQMAQMADADLVVANGLGFEAGLDEALDAVAGDGVSVLELGPELDPLRLEGGSNEAAQGHAGEPDLDPHWFTDPLRMVRAIGLVGRAVAGLDGVDADAVRRQATAYAERIESASDRIADELSAIPAGDRRLITNHDVFGYFAARFGFEVVGTIIPGGSTLAEPSSNELGDLVDLIEDTGVPAVFADTSAPTALADALARESGERIEVVELFSESLGPEGSGGETYLDVIQTNADRILDALT